MRCSCKAFARGRVGRVTDSGVRGLGFKSQGSILKPSTDERGTDAELCVSSPHFTRLRRKVVQTFNFVQISWHCLHKIAGAVSDHSSHRERRCTDVVSVR